MLPSPFEAEEDAPRDITRESGDVLAGTYRVVRHLGSGGSSHVYEVEHVRLGKSFAIKLMRGEIDPGRRTAQRFRREARATACVQNEHIVSVVDCGELEDGTPYLVMELLEGQDLRSLLRREGALPARRATHLVLDACRGLSAAHRAGLIHRDLKPENLFVTQRATGQDCCKVLDFGVAKMAASLSTAHGALVGTVRYMAPEQLADGAAVGPATDVYALGAILYECLSGRGVTDAATVPEVMYQIMNVTPVPLGPPTPEALARLVRRCLDKSPSERPESAVVLARLLERCVRERPVVADGSTIAEDVPRTVLISKHAVVNAWAVASATLLGIGVGVTLHWATGQTLPPASLPRPEAAATLKNPRASEASTPAPAPSATAPSATAPTSSATPQTPAASSAPHPPLTREKPMPRHRPPASSATATSSLFDSSNPYGD